MMIAVPRKSLKNALATITICYIFYLRYTLMTSLHTYGVRVHNVDSVEIATDSGLSSFPKCSKFQLDSIQSALDGGCKDAPWLQKCKYTLRTKCPKQTWLYEHFEDRLQGVAPSPAYIGISVGCNKGFDALNSLRVGSQNDQLDKDAWMKEFFQGKDVHAGVCNQAFEEQAIIYDAPVVKFEEGAQHQMYCIEAMPTTAEALRQTARALGYDKLGFKVINAAGGITDGNIFFPNAKVGIENNGMWNCLKDQTNCVQVPMLSLDTLATKYIKGFEINKNEIASAEAYPIIQTLNIDVEGFDFDVMLGGKIKVLPRVEYIEFEYNWMGSWGKQKLSDAIDMLDELGFQCYWAGEDKLWRITGCVLEDLYATHNWANVACANQNLSPALAQKMETLFLRTLSLAL
jgi:FkbM family methyltransferase